MELVIFESRNNSNHLNATTIRPTVADIGESGVFIVADTIFEIGISITLVCFILCIIFTVCKWQTQKIGTKLQCICFCLLTLQAIIDIPAFHLKDQLLAFSPVGCKVLAIFIHFLLLTTFLWQTSMTFYIWKRFCWKSGLRWHSQRSQTSAMVQNKRDCKTIFRTAMFSIGGSVCLTIFPVVMDICYRDDISKAPFSPPRFGEVRCRFFTTEEAALIYFYGPVALVSIPNVTMFIMTTVVILKSQKKVPIEVDRAKKNSGARWGIFLRLLIIMELTWAYDTLDWAYFAYVYQRNEMLDLFFVNFFLGCNIIESFRGVGFLAIIVWYGHYKKLLRSS